MRYGKNGAIGYTIHRGSGFDCPYCESFTGVVHPMTECLLPLHPRCVCYSVPVYGDSSKIAIPIPKKLKPASALKKDSKVDHKAFRTTALDWAKKNFVREELPNGDTALRLRVLVAENGDELILNTGYIEKVYSHNVRKDSNRLSTIMNIVMASKEWMPNLKYIRTEKGEHHGYPFNIYEGEYNGTKFELQAKVTDGIYPYLIKIK